MPYRKTPKNATAPKTAPCTPEISLTVLPVSESLSPSRYRIHDNTIAGKKTATGVKVPDELVRKLGAGKRPPVVVTINGYAYRNTIAVMNGTSTLSVSAEVREKAGLTDGDIITVELELDTQPREVAVPTDLQKELDKNEAARRFFETLSNSNKKRYIIPIELAKAEETRARRIKKAVADLADGKKYDFQRL